MKVAAIRRLGNMSAWRTSFRRTSFVVQTKILYCKTTITHTISFWRQQLSQLVRKFASQNKAKNAGRSGKNAGMREIHQNAGFPARLRDGWHLWFYPRRTVQGRRATCRYICANSGIEVAQHITVKLFIVGDAAVAAASLIKLLYMSWTDILYIYLYSYFEWSMGPTLLCVGHSPLERECAV